VSFFSCWWLWFLSWGLYKAKKLQQYGMSSEFISHRSLPFLLCHQWLPEYYLLKIVKQSRSSLCDGEQEGVHWWTGNAGTTLSSQCSAIPWCSHKNPTPSHGYRISSQSKNSLSHFSVDKLCDIWWSEEFLLAMLSHKLLVIGA